MRRLRAGSLIGILAAASICTAAHAQENLAASTTQIPAPDQVVSFLALKLALSADQQNAIAPIIVDRQSRFKALLADTDGAPRMKLERARSIMSTSDARINALLNPDQQIKYAALEVEMRQRWRQNAQGE